MEREDKKINFNELLQEYENTVKGVNVEDYKKSIEGLGTDIKLLEREINNLEKRANQVENEMKEFDEEKYINPENKAFMAEELKPIIEKAKRQKEEQMNEINTRKAKKEDELKKLQEERANKQKEIDKVENAGKDIIAKAESKVKDRNAEIKTEIESEKEKARKEIEKLKARKEKYGKDIKNKDGNVVKQLTAEEMVVIERIDAEIKGIEASMSEQIEKLEKETEKNNRGLKKLKLLIKNKEKERLPEEKKKDVPENSEKGKIKKDNEGPVQADEGQVQAEDEPVQGDEGPVQAEDEPVQGDEGPVQAEDEPVQGDDGINGTVISTNTYNSNEIENDKIEDPSEAPSIVEEQNSGFSYYHEPDELQTNGTVISGIIITADKFVINYSDSNSTIYSNKELEGIEYEKLDMSFDRKSERAYRKVIEEKYPELSKKSIKKLDLGLVKILDGINPELCKIYIESVRDGKKLEGLPEIKYLEEVEATTSERDAYVTRRNARNNSKIAENGIKSSLWTRIKDGTKGILDKFMDSYDDRQEIKALEAGDATRNIETEVADETGHEAEKELTIQEQMKVKELTQEKQAIQAQEREARKAVEDNSIGRKAQLNSKPLDIDAIIAEAKDYPENSEGTEYNVDDIIAEVNGDERV